MSLWLRRRDLRTNLYIVIVIKFLATYVYIFLIFFLIFLFDFIVTINLIQLLAAILIRINYPSIYISIKCTLYTQYSYSRISPLPSLLPPYNDWYLTVDKAFIEMGPKVINYVFFNCMVPSRMSSTVPIPTWWVRSTECTSLLLAQMKYT